MSMFRTTPPRTRARALALVVAATAAAVALSGCASTASSSEPVAGFVTQNQSAGVTLTLNSFTEDWAGDVMNEDAQNDVNAESAAIDTFASRQADGLIISVVSDTSSGPNLARAKEAGMKVVCIYACSADWETSGDVDAFILSDQTAMGTEAGAVAVEYIEEQGLQDKTLKFGTLTCASSEVCRQREAGFFAALDEAGISYEIVATEEVHTVDKATPAAENILGAHPDLDFFFAQHEGATQGAVKGVESSGRNVKVFGQDLTEVLANMLLEENPILLTTSGQDAVGIGVTAAQVLSDLVAAGDSTAKPELVPVAIKNYRASDPEAVQEYLDGISG